MNNIDVIANGLPDDDISAMMDSGYTEVERKKRQSEIRNSTQGEYSELIDACRKCLNGDCVDLQKMRDDIFEKL